MGISGSSTYCESINNNKKENYCTLNSLDSSDLKIKVPNISLDGNDCNKSVYPTNSEEDCQSTLLTQRRKTISSTGEVSPNQQQNHQNSPKTCKTPKKLSFSNPVNNSNSSPLSRNGDTNKIFKKIQEAIHPPEEMINTRRSSTPGQSEECASTVEVCNLKKRGRSSSSPERLKSFEQPKQDTSKSMDNKEFVNVLSNRERTNEEKKDLPPLKNSSKKITNSDKNGNVVVGHNLVFSKSEGKDSRISPKNTPISTENQQDIDISINIPCYKQPLVKTTPPTSVNEISCPVTVGCTQENSSFKKEELNGTCRTYAPLEILRKTNHCSRSDLILRKKNRPIIVPEEDHKVLPSDNMSSLPKSKQFNLFKFKSDIPQGNEKMFTQIKYHQSNPHIEAHENVKIVVNLNGAAPNVGGKKLPIFVLPPTSPSKSTQNQTSKEISLTEEKKKRLGERRRVSSSTRKKQSNKKMFSW